MKAILNKDIIIKTNVPDGIEIGNVSKDVGLELMRWDGSKLINLSMLNEIWVEYKNGCFILHCIKVHNSQLVSMNYSIRKKLWNDNGVYKIKTDEQIQTELNLQYRRGHYPQISDQIGEIMKYLSMKTDLTDELQNLIDKIDEIKITYPKEKK